jgi:hypothetical protein
MVVDKSGVVKAPFEFEGGPWFLIWHERTLHDPAQTWLREQIVEVSRNLRGTT